MSQCRCTASRTEDAADLAAAYLARNGGVCSSAAKVSIEAATLVEWVAGMQKRRWSRVCVGTRSAKAAIVACVHGRPDCEGGDDSVCVQMVPVPCCDTLTMGRRCV